MHTIKAKLMVATWLLGALSVAGCSSSGDGSKRSVDKTSWKLVYTHDGVEVELPLEQMRIYLVEEENEYPEVFELDGSGVALVGTFPMNCHVGYEENYAVLTGKTIPIEASGGAMDDKMSYLQMPDGTKAFVVDGSFTPEKIEGSIDGMDGDRTLSGTFTLRVRTALGEEVVAGRFAVLCFTLG